jgi:putative flippase GtrA
VVRSANEDALSCALGEKTLESLVKRLANLRITRYAFVGGIGIPINDSALFCFTFLFSHVLSPESIFLYPIASACAFEVSTTINFVLNQLFTYHEQKLKGWTTWVRRAGKAQLTSLSALLLSYGVGLILVYALRVNQYIANPAGIIVAFIYNYFISKKLVFHPTKPIAHNTIEDTDIIPISRSTR